MLETVINIAREAGNRVLDIYHSDDFRIETKPDGSPVTRADLTAHQYITQALTSQLGLPVISEEAPAPPFEEREHWTELFLVDPVDGTKDFIAKNDEFTINIGLIREGQPVLGVVAVPATDELFYAEKGQGAWHLQNDTLVRLPQEVKEERVLARSWFHDNPTLETFAQKNNIQHSMKMSSAVRMPRLAQGKVNLCLTSNRSYEWDIAAGQILIQETGGTVLDMTTQALPCFNKSDLRNDFILALAKNISTQSLTNPLAL